MNSKNEIKKKIILILIVIIAIFSINNFIQDLNLNHNLNNKDQNKNEKYIFQDNNLKSHDLAFDNTYTGIGSAWNVTHWANRTDGNIAVNFEETSYDTAEIPLGGDWEGIKLKAKVNNLYDERNWCNGSFNYGNDDGSYLLDENDSGDIVNKFQNWTFHKADVISGGEPWGNYVNEMSGNYFENFDGHDCLELRMDGNDTYWGEGRWSYDEFDKLYWETDFHIPRGKVIDSELQFDVRVNRSMNVNAWKFKFYLNNQEIFAINNYKLEQECGGTWKTYKIPQRLWTNISTIFSNPVNNSQIKLNISLEYASITGWWGGFEDREVQQFFVDNIKLITKTEVKPKQIQLNLNQTAVSNTDWGEGTVEINENWQSDMISCNFSSNDIGLLGNYSIELNTDLNLFAMKRIPETNYETNYNLIGTSFIVSNNSIVNWESYAYLSVLNEYRETEMKINYPEDVNITWISDPQNPSINRLNQCDNSTQGLLIVPVDIISSTPNGYWKLKGKSNNYLNDLNIFNNATGTWLSDTKFLSGEYINITAKIIDSSLISGYITQTKAQLHLRFPNGTIWKTASQLKSPDTNGYIYFDIFKIPNSPPNYEVGEYEVIVTWNNSFLTYGMNETGIIYKKFTIIHDSVLEPDQDRYFIEGVFDNRIVNVKVYFKDKENNDAIIGAHIYTKDYIDNILNFSETSPGTYLYEFNATEAEAGNNTLTIYANSTLYLNNQINITINVIKQTILTVDNDYITVPYNQNFTVQFNYLTKNSPETGVNATSLSSDWASDFNFIRTSQGRYNLTCNASLPYMANTLNTLIINVEAINYESKSIPIRIFISSLGTSLELKINGTQTTAYEVYDIEIWQKINLTVAFRDLSGNHINNANVSLSGITNFTENLSLRHYTTIINATDLGQGIEYLSIFASKSNYIPQVFQIVVNIIERQSKLQIFFNGKNYTYDPSITCPLGAPLNITTKYTGMADNHIENGTVHLFGEGISLNLTENKNFEHYSIILDTNELKIGVRTLTIIGEKTSYRSIFEDLRITVRQINTKIETEDGMDTIKVRPGESVKITIELSDLDFGGKIKNAEVTYRSKFGEGDFKETHSGKYEIILENVPEGTYTIEISVYKEGGTYNFDDYEITLIVARPAGETLLFQILLIAAIVGSISLASYLIAYQKRLKYPKQIRKLKKFRKSLNKKKAPRIDIADRETTVNMLYERELENLPKLLKIKPIGKRLVNDHSIKNLKVKIPDKGGESSL